MRRITNRLQTGRKRRGLAAVEVAVCLPILLLLTFGVIESCNLIYFKQSLTVSAYEGVRAAISSNASAATVTDRVQQVLTDRQVQGATIQTIPSDLTTAVYGDYVAVRVSADYSQNALLPGWFFGNRQIEADVRMMKEF